MFDKARYHLDAARAEGLDDHQANVHAGLFFGWAVSRGLVAAWVERGVEAAFAAFRRGELTGPALFAACDGALLDDQFTDEGLAFVAEYYPLATGEFLADYQRALCGGLPSELHVPDTAASAERLAPVLDARLAEFRARWDQARPDLRADRAPVDDAPPDVLPVVPVTTGVALPLGPVGIRIGRADTLLALDAARAGWVVLVPTLTPGRRERVTADELLDVGVFAKIERVTPAEGRPGARDVVLQCHDRATIEAWVGHAPLTARLARMDDPPLDPEVLERVDLVRARAAAVVRSRIDRGESPGQLALAAAAAPAALVDLVVRELPASREEALTVLLAPDLDTRLAVAEDLLLRG